MTREAALLALAIIATVALVGCGVPISAEEMANRPLATQEGGGEELEVLSRGIGVTQDAVRTPIPTAVAAGSTPLAGSTDLTTLQASEATSTPEAAATAASAPTTATPGSQAAAASPTAAASTPTPQPAVAAAASADLASQAIEILNSYRVSLGLSPLAPSPQLIQAAASYARLMADRNWWQCGCDVHIGPDGSTPARRIAAAGYAGRFAGEALAGGQATAQDAINTWLNSPPHRAIVLSSAATHIGIGYYYKAGDWLSHYWVLVTGAE